MKKPKKVKRKSTLRERLLRRWRNGPLEVKELCYMDIGKYRTWFGKSYLTSQKKISKPTDDQLASLSQQEALGLALAQCPTNISFAGLGQANMYPLGHSCQCSVCHPRLGGRGIGRFFSGLF